MLVKFFGNKGGGSPKASMDYLLRKGKENTQFQVLRGEPDLSQSIAESCGFKNAYTVGCLSFE
ncbi:relaxase/mobilization nuclease domain-containing protein, partial [Salmonella enterica subsp. enterica serovar Cerro]